MKAWQKKISSLRDRLLLISFLLLLLLLMVYIWWSYNQQLAKLDQKANELIQSNKPDPSK